VLVANIKPPPSGCQGDAFTQTEIQCVPKVKPTPFSSRFGYAGEALGPGSEVSDGISLLCKPFSVEALAARVETLIATGSSASHSASPDRHEVDISL